MPAFAGIHLRLRS